MVIRIEPLSKIRATHSQCGYRQLCYFLSKEVYLLRFNQTKSDFFIKKYSLTGSVEQLCK